MSTPSAELLPVGGVVVGREEHGEIGDESGRTSHVGRAYRVAPYLLGDPQPELAAAESRRREPGALWTNLPNPAQTSSPRRP